ncbi:hypothetical protein RHCRD62_30594 [Rhodococcus sp. RD6.2]|nr:hypothetical protein RHCRD62_30594 [Rhodococcus sp. RD6.2]
MEDDDQRDGQSAQAVEVRAVPCSVRRRVREEGDVGRLRADGQELSLGGVAGRARWLSPGRTVIADPAGRYRRAT